MQEDDVEKKAGEESEKLKKGDCNKNQEKNQVRRETERKRVCVCAIEIVRENERPGRERQV